MKKIVMALVLGCVMSSSFAQKQLIVLKGEKIVLRLYPGDEIRFRLKGSKSVRTSYVNNIFDTAFVAHNDTIPFHRVDKLYFPQTKLYNVIGGGLVVGGAGIFLIDQFNELVVNGNDLSLDSRISTISVTSLAVGLPLMLIRKKSQRMGGRYRMLLVTRNSVFYKPDPRGFDSPYIPEN